MRRPKASRRPTSLREFENGYWYAVDLIAFGKELGLPAAHRMRKNELEDAIRAFLRTGRLSKTIKSKPLKKGPKDLDLGLALDLPIGTQVAKRPVTYGELIDRYVALNGLERFARVPVARYVYFLADFLAKEKGASHADARAAWKKLKAMGAPKTYDGWKRKARG